MPHPQTNAGSTVIPFRPLGARERRAVRDEDRERGTVLLFTGVRYQRLDDTAVEVEADDLPCACRDEIWS